MLGLRAYSGEGFRQVSDGISVTIDSERFLGLNRRIQPVYTSAAGVAGFNQLAVVPVGKVWCLRTLALSVDSPAASGAGIRIATTTPGSASGVALSGIQNIGASITGSVHLVFPNILLEPGTTIGAVLTNVTGGPFFLSLSGLIEEFEAG